MQCAGSLPIRLLSVLHRRLHLQEGGGARIVTHAYSLQTHFWLHGHTWLWYLGAKSQPENAELLASARHDIITYCCTLLQLPHTASVIILKTPVLNCTCTRLSSFAQDSAAEHAQPISPS